MVLTQDELRSLIDVNQRSPHQLLGMHPLGDGSGLVVRALVPHASKVEIQPVHEKDKPTIKLERIPNSDVFEGVTKAANRVYAYDLVVTDKKKHTTRARDAYSFYRHLANPICIFLEKATSAGFMKSSAGSCA